jgi:hypothetical protein
LSAKVYRWPSLSPEYRRRNKHRWPSASPEAKREWRRKNREHVLAQRRKYYQENKERILFLQKQRDLDPVIKDHKRKISAKWRANNPRRHRGPFRNHLSERGYTRLMEQQGNECAVCHRPFSSQRLEKPVIDHDHKCCPIKGRSCGKCIRGIIHSGCNLLLGYANDSPGVLQQASHYLLRYDEIKLKEKLILA